MKLTFQDQYQMAQEIAKVSDAANTARFKRDINSGGARFLAVLNRPGQRRERFADIVDSQQFYQVPEDARKPKDVLYLMGDQWVPLKEVTDEDYWNRLNWVPTTGVPTCYFIQDDEIGLYPTPSGDVTDGLKLVFFIRQLSLSQDDYTTGTVALTEDSADVTGSGTTFNSQMVGRFLTLTDGSDANWYRIAAYNSPTSLTLDNVYQGITAAAATYRIGEVMDIPEEYLVAPVDYAMHRYFISRDTPSRYSGGRATQFLQSFQQALDECKQLEGRKNASAVIEPNGNVRGYNGLYDTPRQIGP